MSSWTNELALEFLQLYRREQLLWDPKHPEHKNRGEVANAWLRIKSSMSINCTVIDLKKKKESLMTSFRMHFNKKKRSQEAYHTTWFAYPLMESFLGGKYECDSTNQMENEFFNNVVSLSHPTTTPDMSNSSSGRNLGVVERSDVTRHSCKPPAQTTAGNTQSGNNFIFLKKRETNEELTNKSEDTKDTDEYDLYGQLLAKKLRKLDEHQRDMAMHEIDNIMFRAKMQSNTSTSRSYSSSPSPVPRKVKSPIFIVAQQTHPQFEDENTPYQDHMQPQTLS